MKTCLIRIPDIRSPGWWAGLACLFALALGLTGVGAVQAEPRMPAPVTAAAGVEAPVMLTLFNRDIVELRALLGGLTAEQRVARAQRAFAELPAAASPARVTMQPMSLTEGSGYTLQVDGQALFTLMAADLDLEQRLNLKEAAEHARFRLEDAAAARQAQRTPRTWLVGFAIVLVALGVFALCMRWLLRARDQLQLRADSAAQGVGPKSYLLVFVFRLLGIGLWVLIGALSYGVAVAVLDAFPWSAPWGDALARYVFGLLGDIATGLIGSIPGLMMIVVVLFVARMVQDVLRLFLSRVQAGSIRVPFLHADTVGATRLLLNVLIWAIAIAIAYPYLPGSSSDAFKGVSVLFGVMVTLGSTGLVNQLMSGLVIVYSRSLKKGDFVTINGSEGVVTEVSALAVKLLTLHNEEITLPNNVITSSPIRNYSKLSGQQGTLLSTKVTIGYDAPWRQVHALLTEAAERTQGIRKQPEPFVYQRALSDFYVEYELFVHVDSPQQRVPILSALHGAIQDGFNAHGVQIMSPHYMEQPPGTMVVPREKWFEPPARPAGQTGN
ncbi:MAG TPA: mechanosensitive ion channel domain-containing protein [Burkholderiaceae bacterium]|nr:mechanosensitive ion channel domain-containing protein [Burkholderiaceae bacterium]